VLDDQPRSSCPECLPELAATVRLSNGKPAFGEAGHGLAFDYEVAGAPALHIRVQELFGLTQHLQSPTASWRSPCICSRRRTGQFRSRATFRASGGDGGRWLEPR
jgi:hypothetical protein